MHGGRFDEAAELLAEARGKSFADIPEDLVWTHGITMYAEAAVLLGDGASAEILTNLLRPHADQVGFTGCASNGHISQHLGALATVLGDYDEGEGYFHTASRWNAAAHAPYMGCRTDVQWASMLLRRRHPGDAQRAQALLRRAGKSARSKGFAGVTRDVEALQQLPDPEDIAGRSRRNLSAT